MNMLNEMKLRLVKIDMLMGDKTFEELDDVTLTKAYATFVVGVNNAKYKEPEMRSEIKDMCMSYFYNHVNQCRSINRRHKVIMDEYGYRQRPKEFIKLMKKIDDGCNFHMAE